MDAFESRKADLKGDGAAGRWFNPLEHHVQPKPGRMGEMAKSLQRDPQLESLLTNRKAELGIGMDTGHRLGAEFACCHGIDLSRGRDLGLSDPSDLQPSPRADTTMGRAHLRYPRSLG